MNHLKILYPESRAAKKRAELDRLATSYTIALCSYLPCIDHQHSLEKGTSLADDILSLLETIAEVQARIAPDPYTTGPLQGDTEAQEPPAPEPLTHAQREHIKRLCERYGIGVYQETGNPIFYISHPSLGETSIQVTTEAELYTAVCDLAQKEHEKEKQTA